VNYLTNDNTGTGSASGVVNGRGTVVSGADTSVTDPNFPNVCLLCPADPLIVHAFAWHEGVLTDLGALPGVNSSVANWISANGLIAGISENGLIDPLLGVPEVKAVLWKDGEVIDLGTLEGGFESAASAVNSRGQVAGTFLNTIPDPFSPFGPAGTEVHAFLWESGVMKDLGTLGGPETVAYFVNERGQVVGTSFTSSTANPASGLPTLDPFLWENGKMLDLGTLGGTSGTPNGLNNRGQVVGLSNLAGDQTAHPFLWTKSGGMHDIGTLGGIFGQANWISEAGEIVGLASVPGDQAFFAFLWKDGVLTNLGAVEHDACSNAWNINSQSQIVGVSAKTCAFAAAERHAFLWDGGHMIDLNSFLPPGAALQQLTDAYNINDRGEIVGLGVPPGCDDEFACGRIFVLIPCDDERSGSDGCRDADLSASADKNSAASHSKATTATQHNLAPGEIKDRIRALLTNRNRRFRSFPPN
jgi:probable HAF family extracellular repeat protein